MLSAPAASLARDIGMMRVLPTLECDQVLACIATAAARQEEITSDDAWRLLEGAGIISLAHPNAMGAAFRNAALSGVIHPTGRVRKSARVSGRRRNVQVWRSLVFEGGRA